MLVKSLLIRIRKGEELKAPRHTSAAATRNGNLPSCNGSLPYEAATCLIPDSYSFYIVYKLVKILIITLYTILELLYITILYNI